MTDWTLAIDGGTPVRTEDLPERQAFGAAEEAQVLEALRSQNLCYATGTKVYEFARELAGLFGVTDVVRAIRKVANGPRARAGER